MKVRVATVQFSPAFDNKDANLAQLEHWIRQAAANGAELIVLPELCTTGYSFMNKNDAKWAAEPFDAKSSMTLVRMMALAKELQVHLVYGFMEIDPGTHLLYNSQAYVDPFGLHVSYRKANRWGNDFLWAAPGREHPPIVTVHFKECTRKVGLLICRDVRDRVSDSWTALYQPGEADIVCLSANWGDGGFPANTWMEFVENNRCALVVANRFGKEGNNDFGEGGVCLIERSGTVICEGLQWSAPCVVYGDL